MTCAHDPITPVIIFRTTALPLPLIALTVRVCVIRFGNFPTIVKNYYGDFVKILSFNTAQEKLIRIESNDPVACLA